MFSIILNLKNADRGFLGLLFFDLGFSTLCSQGIYFFLKKL